jgi:hypothetical protein
MSDWTFNRCHDARRTRDYWSSWTYRFGIKVNDTSLLHLCDRDEVLRDQVIEWLESEGPYDKEKHRMRRLDFRAWRDEDATLSLTIHATKPSFRLLKRGDCDSRGSGVYLSTLPDIPDLAQWVQESMLRQNDIQKKRERLEELRDRSIRKVRKALELLQHQAVENIDLEAKIGALRKAFNDECRRMTEDERFRGRLFEFLGQDTDCLDLAELTFERMDVWGTILVKHSPLASIPTDLLEEVAKPLSERLATLEEEEGDSE